MTRKCCCSAHKATGNPLGCYLTPQDEISLARRKREAEMDREWDEWSAASYFARVGMIDPSRVPPMPLPERLRA